MQDMFDIGQSFFVEILPEGVLVLANQGLSDFSQLELLYKTSAVVTKELEQHQGAPAHPQIQCGLNTKIFRANSASPITPRLYVSIK